MYLSVFQRRPETPKSAAKKYRGHHNTLAMQIHPLRCFGSESRAREHQNEVLFTLFWTPKCSGGLNSRTVLTPTKFNFRSAFYALSTFFFCLGLRNFIQNQRRCIRPKSADFQVILLRGLILHVLQDPYLPIRTRTPRVFCVFQACIHKMGCSDPTYGPGASVVATKSPKNLKNDPKGGVKGPFFEFFDPTGGPTAHPPFLVRKFQRPTSISTRSNEKSQGLWVKVASTVA